MHCYQNEQYSYPLSNRHEERNFPKKKEKCFFHEKFSGNSKIVTSQVSSSANYYYIFLKETFFSFERRSFFVVMSAYVVEEKDSVGQKLFFRERFSGSISTAQLEKFFLSDKFLSSSAACMLGHFLPPWTLDPLLQILSMSILFDSICVRYNIEINMNIN